MSRLEWIRYSDELRDLIIEHPDYPLVVMCGEGCNPWHEPCMVATDVRFFVGEYLDCDQPINDEFLYSDRDDFEEDLEEWLWDEMCDDTEPTEEEFQKRLLEEKKKYEENWKNVIYIYADN